jgi:predicted amidophosphoribosyltransferase
MIAANYAIDEALASPEPTHIWVLDDMLTTGAHFKAAQRVLVRRFPSAKVFGVFIARRAPLPDEPADEGPASGDD